MARLFDWTLRSGLMLVLVACLVYCFYTVMMGDLPIRYLTRLSSVLSAKNASTNNRWQKDGGLDHGNITSSLSHLLRYSVTLQSGVNKSGRSFPRELLSWIKYPDNYVNLDSYDLRKFTIITAVDKSHYKESIFAVGGFQKAFPNHTIVYYDLGLTSHQREQVLSWCNVRYRKFDFDRYPAHVRKLKWYAFKMVLVYEAINEFDAVFWIDSSIRPTLSEHSWNGIFQLARKSGFVQFRIAGRRSTSYTMPGLYEYLPTDLAKLSNFPMLAAGVLLVYRTELMYWRALHWLYLCALTPDCIAPKGHKLFCPKVASAGKPPCHRYDQSTWSVLIGNVFNFNLTKFYASESHPITVVRRASGQFRPVSC